MRNHFRILLALIFLFPIGIYAQCTDFAKEKGLPLVNADGYVSDGHLNTLTMSEGEEINMHRPLYKGLSYRIVFIADENIQTIGILVKDSEKRRIMNKVYKGKAVIWDVTPSENLELTIGMLIPYAGLEEMKQGCVAMLVGVRN